MLEKHIIVTDSQGAQWRFRRFGENEAYSNGIEILGVAGTARNALLLIPEECVSDFKEALEALAEVA